jgi:hypothetical protein
LSELGQGCLTGVRSPEIESRAAPGDTDSFAAASTGARIGVRRPVLFSIIELAMRHLPCLRFGQSLDSRALLFVL